MNLPQIYRALQRSIYQPLMYNAAFILGANLIPGFMGLAFWGIASRLYSTSQIGIASVVISSVALISGIAGAGTSFGVIRFLPESNQPPRFLNSIYTLNFILSIFTGLVFILGLRVWSPSLSEYQSSPWSAIGFLVFVIATTLGAVIRDTFIARRKAIYSLVYTIICNALRVVLIFAGTNWGMEGLVGSAMLAYTLALLVSWFGFLPAVEKDYQVRIAFDWSILRLIIPYSMGNYLASLLVLLPPTILPLITLEQLGATASGYAYIALMLGSVLPSPGLALASSAFAEGANNPADIRQILIKAFLAGGLVTLILAGIAFLGAQWILWVYGADYARESTALLRWLALASPLIVINQLYFTYLRLSKRIPGLVARCLLNTGIILLSVIFLIDRLGIIANGIGVLAGNIAVSITLLGEFSTILRLENMGKQEGII